MSLPLSFTNTSGYVDLLFKKYLGITESNTNLTYAEEAPGSSRPHAFSNSQLYSQPVPAIAPSGPVSLNSPNATVTLTSLTPDLVLYGYVKSDGSIDPTLNSNLGIVYTSLTYPWIQFIQNLSLTSVLDGFSYRFTSPVTGNNLLVNLIPFNYDPVKKSYKTYLYPSGGLYLNSSLLVTQANYIIDIDAGYLIFPKSDWTPGVTPLISFYRYAGTIGIPTNIGNFAGAYAQYNATGTYIPLAYGNLAGMSGQNANAIAIGNQAGQYGQGTGSIAIGYLAGPTGMTSNSIALNASGKSLSATGATGGFYVAPIASYSGSVGPFTLLAYGKDNQVVGITGDGLTKLGIVGGSASVTGFSVQIGAFAGMTGQGTGAIAVGYNSGQFYQNTGAISMGINAGQGYQGTGAIAIGMNAGQTGQGQNSIAIGNFAGPTSMTANSIAINASQTALSATGPTGGFFVAPIAPFTNSTGPFNILAYGPDKQIVTVTGTNGLNLSLSTPTFTSDLWSLTNLVNQPPPVTLTIDKTTTTDVYITFSYPQQVYSWLSVSGLLPYINNMFVNLYSTDLTSVDTPNPQNGVTGTTYLTTSGNSKNTSGLSTLIASSTDPNNVVQCINVTSAAAKTTAGISDYSSTSGKSLKTYVIPYAQLPAGKSAALYLWYTNSVNNPSINVSSVSFSYSIPQPPKQVTDLTITPGPTTVTITFSFTGSSQADSSDPSSTALINYAIKYQPYPNSNPYRYGGVVDTTTRDYTTKLNNQGYSIGGSFTNNTISATVYPSTRYVVTINASNENPNTNGAFTGTTGISGLTPSPVLQNTTANGVNNLIPASTLIPAKSIYAANGIGNVLTAKASAPTLSNLPYNIHNVVASTGSTGLNLVNFETSLYGFTGPNGVTGIKGPSLSLNGFSGLYNYSAGPVNGITISAPSSGIVDQYVGGQPGYNGYYLKSTINAAFDGSTLIPNSNQYTLSVTGTYPSTNSGFVNTNYTQFYYDGEQITPYINTTNNTGFTGGFVSTNSIQICGVTGISQYNTSSNTVNSVVALVTSVTGIGRYFYNKDKILAYSTPTNLQPFTTPTETDLSRLTSGFGPSGFKDNNVFTNNNLPTYPTAYNNGPITFGVTAYNVAGTAAPVTYSDGKKYLMFDSTLSQLANSQRSTGVANIPTIISSVTTPGIRLWSCNPGYENVAQNSNINTVVNTFTNAGSSYSTISPFFDHSQSLMGVTGSGELLLSANGLYKSGNDVDYSSSYYTSTVKNTLNYSSLATSKLVTLPTAVNNYRYATFAWTLPADPSTAINFITINLTNSSTLTGNGTSWYTDSGKTRKLFLYYRVEDTANKNNWSSGGTISTPWIDGNSFDSTYANNGGYTSSTYPSTTQNVDTPTPMGNTIQTGRTLLGLTSAPSATSTNTSFTVKLPNPISQYNKASAMYLYVRIGVHMVDTFSFGNPTALISTQAIGAGFPSTGVAFTTATAGTTVDTFQINSTFTTPTPFFTDTNNQYGNVNGTLVGSPTINFNYTYTPVSNSFRYVSGTANGVYNTNPVPVTGISTTVITASSYSISQTTVFPDTVYKVIGTSITNSSGLTTLVTGSEATTYATSGFNSTYLSTSTFTSPSLSLSLGAMSSSYTTVTATAKTMFIDNMVSGCLSSSGSGTTTYNIITTKSSTMIANIGDLTIQNAFATRGTNSSGKLMVTLNAQILFNNSLSGTKETLSINGFGWSATASTGDTLQIKSPDIADQFTNEKSGYYQKATNIMIKSVDTVTTKKFPSIFSAPSSNAYNLNVTAQYSSTNSNSNALLTFNFPNFYYDGEMQKPTATLSLLTIAVANFTNISGIAIYSNTSTIPLTYTLNATNLGINFCNSTQTIVYSSTTGPLSKSTETSFSTFSSTNTITYTAPTSYTAQTVTLSATPYNIVNNPGPGNIKDPNTSATATSSSTTIIYDPQSIAIVTAQYVATTLAASSFTIVQNTPIQGCRLWSSATVGSELTLATAAGETSAGSSLLSYVSYAGTSYSAVSTPYDNTKDISSIASPTYKYEVLLTNGLYTTVPACYKSYTSNGATYDYSTLGDIAKTITGYKYITFGWKIGIISTQCKTVTFTISGCASSSAMTSSTGEFVIGSNKLLLYYRVEDATSTTTITSFTKSGAVSTVWINGNSLSGTLFSASSYNNPGASTTIYTTNYIGLASNTSCSYDGNSTVTFTEVLANPLTNTANPYYLYCRLGLPSNFSFTGIKANLST